MSQVQINLPQAWIKDAGAAGVDGHALQDAVGYLVLWGAAYEAICIGPDNKTDILAAYGRDATHRGFVMLACWRPDEKKYTFHG